MSYGKYSPLLPNANQNDSFFRFNSLGQEPVEWTAEDAVAWRNGDATKEYCAMTMSAGYDDEGFDRYGYSDFVLDFTQPEGRRWVGCGQGVDRAGMTEYDYILEHNNEDLFKYE